MTVNIIAMQNVWHFLQPGSLTEVEKTLAHSWPQAIEKTAHQELNKNERFLTAPPPHGTYVDG
jgi:hypothetical protein